MNIGVLTGGGDCPGLNAVIRAIVKSARFKYGWDVTGIEEGFEGLKIPVKSRPLTPWTIRGILPTGGTILGTTSGMKPGHVKRAIPKKRQDAGGGIADLSKMVKKNMNLLGLSGLIVIGGDGTLKIAKSLYKDGVRIIGVPKTIDNDIPSTDLTFGFHTAVNTATDALDKLHTTAESHHRVMVVEVMGRYVGWIALEAGIAGGADVILIPEIPFRIDRVCKTIIDRYKRGSRFSIVIVAEGAKPAGGKRSLIKPTEGGSAERLGGVGNKVGEEIARLMEMDVRVTVLGHLQRGGSPTPFDRILATRFGIAAVNLIAQKRFGEMVCLKGSEIKSVPLSEATRKMKRVPSNGALVRNAETIGVSFGR
ncbi:MAG: 6-phosphofructokinase [Nitrospiria bacterium]